MSATAFPSGVRGMPVEANEAITPVIFWRKEFREDSGGPGAQRGGLGQVIEIGGADGMPFDVLAMFERVDNAPRGRDGGGTGATGRVSLASGATLRPKDSRRSLRTTACVLKWRAAAVLAIRATDRRSRSPKTCATAWCRCLLPVSATELSLTGTVSWTRRAQPPFAGRSARRRDSFQTSGIRRGSEKSARARPFSNLPSETDRLTGRNMPMAISFRLVSVLCLLDAAVLLFFNTYFPLNPDGVQPLWDYVIDPATLIILALVIYLTFAPASRPTSLARKDIRFRPTCSSCSPASLPLSIFTTTS